MQINFFFKCQIIKEIAMENIDYNWLQTKNFRISFVSLIKN